MQIIKEVHLSLAMGQVFQFCPLNPLPSHFWASRHLTLFLEAPLPTLLGKRVFHYDSAQPAPCQAADARGGGAGAAARGRGLAPRLARAPPALRLLKTRPAPGSRTADAPAPLR